MAFRSTGRGFDLTTASPAAIQITYQRIARVRPARSAAQQKGQENSGHRP